MGNASHDRRPRNLFRAEHQRLFSERDLDRRYRNPRRWVGNSAAGAAAYLANLLTIVAAIVAFTSVVAAPGLGKEYSRHPALYEPSPPAAYEPAYPTVYEPAPSRTHQPIQRGYQTVEYDHAESRTYLENFLQYFWYWLWCNIVLILVIVIIVWIILRIYYSIIINIEFARASAALEAANLAAAKPILTNTRANLPI